MGIYLRNFALYDLQPTIKRQLRLSNLKRPNKQCEDNSLNALRFTAFPEIAFTFKNPNGNSVKIFRYEDFHTGAH